MCIILNDDGEFSSKISILLTIYTTYILEDYSPLMALNLEPRANYKETSSRVDSSLT